MSFYQHRIISLNLSYGQQCYLTKYYHLFFIKLFSELMECSAEGLSKSQLSHFTVSRVGGNQHDSRVCWILPRLIPRRTLIVYPPFTTRYRLRKIQYYTINRTSLGRGGLGVPTKIQFSNTVLGSRGRLRDPTRSQQNISLPPSPILTVQRIP